MAEPAQIRIIQALRAVAALVVVGFHATVLWHDRADPTAAPWQNGNAGVDLFFVISGVIMVVSSRRLVGRADAARQFLTLRAIRIVPLYWLATFAKLAAIAAVPALALHTSPTAWNVAASLLFLPSRDATGLVRPVLDVGWTLTFEALFYLLFALALALAVPALRLVGPAMAVLAAASLLLPGHATPLTFLADPIVLEFVAGVAIGTWLLRQPAIRRAPLWAAPALAAALAAIALAPAETRWARVAVWGGAATLAVLAAILLEPRLGRRVPRLLIAVGEASYALYLTHGFILPPLGVLAKRLPWRGHAAEAALIAAALALSTLAALATYRLIEAPITRALRRLADTRAAATLARPESPV